MAIHKRTGCDKPVWWNYWDYCPRNEKEYMIRLNYLLYNPVKHGYTANLDEYAYSSFHETISRTGRQALVKQFREYPDYRSLELVEKEDDF